MSSDGVGEPTSLGVKYQKHIGVGEWADLNSGSVTFWCDLGRLHNFSEPQIHNLLIYFILFFVFNIGVGTQGLVRARQALYCRFVFNPFFYCF